MLVLRGVAKTGAVVFLGRLGRLGRLARSHVQNTSAIRTARTRAQARAQPHPAATLRVISKTPHATAVLAAYFASNATPGDCYLLLGPVGAGKSHWARAFIRYAVGDENLEVPSPTYLLHNVYERGREGDVHHYDLYRLGAITEAEYSRLDLARSFAGGVSLIEWPERLMEGVYGREVPEGRVEIGIELGCRSAVDEADAAEGDEGDEGDDEEEKEEARPRIVHVRGYGERCGELVEVWAGHLGARGEALGLELVR